MDMYDQIINDIIDLNERASWLVDIIDELLKNPKESKNQDNRRVNAHPSEEIPSLTWKEAYSINLEKMKEIKKLIRSLKGW